MNAANRQAAGRSNLNPRWLIVNADDFGRASGVNHGIVVAHERGIVTSASLMVRWPFAREAADYAKRHTRLGLGLHLDLGEWAFRDRTWVTVYEVVPLDSAPLVTAEIERQINQFHDLIGRAPTHLDSHQHVHRYQPVRSALLTASKRLGAPMRHAAEAPHYCGDFYGQSAQGESLHDAIGVDALVRLIEALRPNVSELACHPGMGSDDWPPYEAERAIELESLCDPRVREAIEREGVTLCDFRVSASPNSLSLNACSISMP